MPRYVFLILLRAPLSKHFLLKKISKPNMKNKKTETDAPITLLLLLVPNFLLTAVNCTII